jgi:RNA polymerase sigma-70 factor (ECF subfamily)
MSQEGRPGPYPHMPMTRTDPARAEGDLIQAARAGDEGAYARLVEPHRRELHAHCYRMLGSPHDADDALQDALLRAWRGLPRFAGRSSLRGWLYKIATNASLDVIGRRQKRVLPLDYGPPADPHDPMGAPIAETVWIEPYPDQLLGPEAGYEQREAVELAFVAALQRLPARQRAVLILREVLGFSAQEVAETLESSVASVNSALQRARKAIEDHLPDQTQQATLRALGDEGVQELVETYMRAWEAGDVDTIVGLLTEDVTMAMPPMPTWFRGLEASTGFLRNFVFAQREGRKQLISFAGEERNMRLVPSRASGQLAFGNYHWNEEAGAYLPVAIQVLTLRGSRIRDITAFVDPALVPSFGLPERIGADE